MIKPSKLLLLCIIYTKIIHSQQFDVESAVKYAMSHNYNYKKQELDRAITYEKTQEVLTMGFPKVNGTVGYQNNFLLPTSILPGEIVGKPGTTVPVQFGTSNNGSVGFTLQQLLFDGRYLVGVQARQSLKNLADIQLKVSEQGVKELIQKSFFAAISADNSIVALQENQKIIDKLLDDTKKTYKEGLIEELDVERMQYNTLTLKNTISNLVNQRELAYMALKYNMGYPIDSSLNLYGSLDQRLNSIKEEALMSTFNIKNKPEYQLIEENINLKKFDLKQTKAGYLPSVYGSANYGWQAQRKSFDFFQGGPWYGYGNFGIQMQVPIFDGFTKKYQVSQTKKAYEKALLDKLDFENGSKIQTNQSLINLKNALIDFDNSQNILKLSENILNKTQLKYKAGIGSSFELAQSQNDKIQQQIKVIQSLLNINLKYIELKKSLGNL